MKTLRSTLRSWLRQVVFWTGASWIVVFAACGDVAGPTASGEEAIVASVTVESGQDQRDTVRRRGQEVAARVTDDAGNPIRGRTVNFENRTEGGPEWTASTLTTNGEGRVMQTPTFGTVAWTALVPGDSAHVVELVASNEGAPDVVATLRVVQDPEEVDDVSLGGTTFSGTNQRTIPGGRVVDRFGNPALWWLEADSIGVVQGATPGSIDARTLRAEKFGTSDLRVRVEGDTICIGTVSASANGVSDTLIVADFPLKRKDPDGCDF